MADVLAQTGGPKTAAVSLPVCAVIVTYNRFADLCRCLNSLARQDPSVARVIVVDNGSTDGTVEFVKRDYPWVDLLLADGNIGPCLARNAAAMECRQEFLWFLDSDAEVIGADGAARLHAALAGDPSMAAIGGEAMLDADGRIVGVKRLRVSSNAMIRGDAVLASHGGAGVSPCQVIASCNLMVRRRDFMEAGGFDPFYFFFYEDMDLTWRLFRAGRKLGVLSPMPVVHRFSESVRITRLWLLARNRMYFWTKTMPLWRLPILPLADAAFLLLPDLRSLMRRCRQPAAAVSVVTVGAAPQVGYLEALGRAARMAFRTVAMLALGYAALPAVLARGLAARRQRGGPVAVAPLRPARGRPA